MIERPFGFDPVTGKRETFFYDELTGDFHIKTEQDIEPVLEHANDMRKLHRGAGGGKWGDGQIRVASVPLSVYHEQLVKTGKIRDKKEIKKWLNQAENQVFRTRPGRV
ncbi:MAG TPA: hypothetical protein VFI41_12750 [Gemmatimonadales bacterium]|nr:hypothetical protein [Gemmatimonadales bacterium]